MKYFLKKQKAFTLVEVLIAVVILVAVIGAVTGLERSHIITGVSSKYNIQANGVGQEGVNLVKAISDKVALGGSTGGDCTDPNTCAAGIYYLKTSTNELMQCKVSGVPITGTDQFAIDSCNVPDEGKVIIDGKEFTRKIVIPAIP